MYLFASSLINVALFCSAVGVLLYWYLTYTFDYWKKRNVVFYKPYPLLGTFYLQLFSGKPFAVALQKMYAENPNEDVIGGFISRQPFLVVRNPDLIKLIFVKDFNHFTDRGLKVNTEREPLGKHLVFVTGDTWRFLRQKLTPTFTSAKMRHAFPLLLECGKELQHHIHDVVENGQEPEFKEIVAKYSTDVIGTYAFGLKMNSMKDEDSPFRVMGKKLFEPSAVRMIKFALNNLAPSLFDMLGLRIFDLEIQDFFIGLIKSVVQSRDSKPSARHDFIDLLIELKCKGYVQSDKFHENEALPNEHSTVKITDELLAAQAFVFFTAGFETSSTTMSYALYELAKNKQVQQKLINEIDNILSQANGQVTYENVKEMKYLQMVIAETLRKYPPLGFLNRLCVAPYTFPKSQIKLDKGVLTSVPVYAIHHDPKYYPEPDKFIPERFLPEEVAKRHPFVYLPFGDGPRVCIGFRFAKIQMMIGLISILEKYTVEVGSKTVPEIRFSPGSFILTSDKGIHLKVNERKHTK